MANETTIKFEGNISKDCKNFLLKEQIMSLIYADILFLAILIPINICIGIYWDHLLLWFLVIIFAIAILLPFAPFYRVETPKQILFIDGSIFITLEKFELTRYNSDIKKIIDFGSGYYFKFYFPHKSVYCLCQKDLLTEGTIKEFEDIFGDKIIRKN